MSWGLASAGAVEVPQGKLIHRGNFALNDFPKEKTCQMKDESTFLQDKRLGANVLAAATNPHVLNDGLVKGKACKVVADGLQRL